MEIIQQISNHPFTPTIKRKVRVLTDFTNFGVSRINIAGGNIAENPKIEAQYEVFEYIEVQENDINGVPQTVEKIITIKYVPYTCSNTARIVPSNTGLLYITDSTYPAFSTYPTETNFVLELKLRNTITIDNVTSPFYKTGTTFYTQEELHKLFILNFDSRSTGSIFNK